MVQIKRLSPFFPSVLGAMAASSFERLGPLFQVLENATGIQKRTFHEAYVYNNLSANKELPDASSLEILLHFAEASQKDQNRYPAAVYLPLLSVVFNRDFSNNRDLLECYQSCVFKFASLSLDVTTEASRPRSEPCSDDTKE